MCRLKSKITRSLNYSMNFLETSHPTIWRIEICTISHSINRTTAMEMDSHLISTP